MEAKRKRGGQVNNLNAIKHGKYSKRDFLSCAVCIAKDKCQHYDAENQIVKISLEAVKLLAK